MNGEHRGVTPRHVPFCITFCMSPRTVVAFDVQSAERRVFEEALAPLGGVAFLRGTGLDGDRAAMLREAEALICWFPDRELRPDDRAALGRIGLIQLLSAGADHLDFAALPGGALVASNVGAYAAPMAEHVLGMVVAQSRWSAPALSSWIRPMRPR